MEEHCRTAGRYLCSLLKQANNDTTFTLNGVIKKGSNLRTEGLELEMCNCTINNTVCTENLTAESFLVTLNGNEELPYSCHC